MESQKVFIRSATEADADAIARVHHAALSQFHDFYNAFFQRPVEEIIPLSTVAALQNSKNRFLVAVVPESDAVVGFIRYHVVDATEPAAATTTVTAPETHATSPPPTPSIFAIKSHMEQLWERFGHPREDEMDECYEKAANGRKHNYIKHIMVDPVHQRKGIGAKLLGTVLNVSDAEKVPTFLVASAEGHGLYKGLGFEDLGTWTIDNDYWSKEIVQHERRLGIMGNATLAEKFEGNREIEKCMVRWNKSEEE
ncbi:uncharacterized protein CTRU02_201208 [Colletotrichum truncatum]|uniref:Uncharacterized protein n=1 Tax=Colletotrichum truncatum TaxID=5467 RepID=A0ACC3ZGP5_COLTU|nr:uncharacterized protein CTRU02_07994 [Colletotrichum truncatum]KAF6790474.1 hypothetical protein CTRU02_07994 [Colletotrichum truncatum]